MAPQVNAKAHSLAPRSLTFNPQFLPNEKLQELQTQIKDEASNDVDSLFDDSISEDSDDTVYKPRPQLPQARVNKRPLSYLIKGMDDKTLDVDPEYQREVVWTGERMTGLINSIMESFYIPPIILNVKGDPGTRQWTRICVDGKQRLSSVYAFVKGLIPCHDQHGNKWWFTDMGTGRSAKKILPEKDKKNFLCKDFVVFEYEDLSPDQEEDLFQRVQMGVQLSLAEKLRASSGPWQEYVKLFVHDFDPLLSLLKDRSRATEFRVILSCFSQILEVLYPNSNDGKPKIATAHRSLLRLIQNHKALDDATKSHFSSVFNRFQTLVEEDPSIFRTGQRFIKGVKTFSPVEFLAVTVLISMYGDTRNNILLLGDVWELRLFLRERHKELQINSHSWSSIWEFLEQLERFRGTVQGGTTTANHDSMGHSKHLENMRDSLDALKQKPGRSSVRDKLKALKIDQYIQSKTTINTSGEYEHQQQPVQVAPPDVQTKSRGEHQYQNRQLGQAAPTGVHTNSSRGYQFQNRQNQAAPTAVQTISSGGHEPQNPQVQVVPGTARPSPAITSTREMSQKPLNDRASSGYPEPHASLISRQVHWSDTSRVAHYSSASTAASNDSSPLFEPPLPPFPPFPQPEPQAQAEYQQQRGGPGKMSTLARSGDSFEAPLPSFSRPQPTTQAQSQQQRGRHADISAPPRSGGLPEAPLPQFPQRKVETLQAPAPNAFPEPTARTTSPTRKRLIKDRMANMGSYGSVNQALQREQNAFPSIKRPSTTAAPSPVLQAPFAYKAKHSGNVSSSPSPATTSRPQSRSLLKSVTRKVTPPSDEEGFQDAELERQRILEAFRRGSSQRADLTFRTSKRRADNDLADSASRANKSPKTLARQL